MTVHQQQQLHEPTTTTPMTTTPITTISLGCDSVEINLVNITFCSNQLFQNPADPDYDIYKNNTVFPSIWIEVSRPDIHSWIFKTMNSNGGAGFCAP